MIDLGTKWRPVEGKMSLSLIQDYSSAEEREDEVEQTHNHDFSDEDADAAAIRSVISDNSGLPSASDVFSQILGPPQFLHNSVEEKSSSIDVDYQQSRRRNRRNKEHLPAAKRSVLSKVEVRNSGSGTTNGAVMEAKAHLVGIHERVRSDMEHNQPTASVSNKTQGAKRVASATNPNAEDAAELLRMCLHCGIPKTFSNERGMVCPVCNDRPPADPSNESKKKSSVIKDKEKSKRMKGQSSHATWKSETEMQLRQQFD